METTIQVEFQIKQQQPAKYNHIYWITVNGLPFVCVNMNTPECDLDRAEKYFRQIIVESENEHAA